MYMGYHFLAIHTPPDLSKHQPLDPCVQAAKQMVISVVQQSQEVVVRSHHLDQLCECLFDDSLYIFLCALLMLHVYKCTEIWYIIFILHKTELDFILHCSG